MKKKKTLFLFYSEDPSLGRKIKNDYKNLNVGK